MLRSPSTCKSYRLQPKPKPTNSTQFFHVGRTYERSALEGKLGSGARAGYTGAPVCDSIIYLTTS